MQPFHLLQSRRWARHLPDMLPSRTFHYGWIIVGVTCLALLTGAGVRSTPGILMVPLEQEFHWSRATIALAVSINLILYGCIGPFAAAIMERFGIRRSVMCALAVVTSSALLTLTHEEGDYYMGCGKIVSRAQNLRRRRTNRTALATIDRATPIVTINAPTAWSTKNPKMRSAVTAPFDIIPVPGFTRSR